LNVDLELTSTGIVTGWSFTTKKLRKYLKKKIIIIVDALKSKKN
jgi:hypothetical protein